MREYKVLLFDLDGTLSDPKVGITKSVQYALKKMNIIHHDLDQLECFIGPPLTQSFSDFYHFNEAQSEQAINYYRERFTKKGMFENILYDQIPELLKHLKEQGFTLIVATSKPTVFAEHILKFFKLDPFFDSIVGSHLDGTRSLKGDIIQYILSTYYSYKKSDFVMIGDRKHDVIGAHQTGIDSIGVGYGYGTLEELQAAQPNSIAQSVNELKQLLLKNHPKSHLE